MKTKLRIGEKMASISVKKFVSTKAKELDTPEEAAIVQRVMCHFQKTAERAYARTSLTKLGAQALDIIARVTSEEKLEAKTGDDIKQPSSIEESGSIMPQPLEAETGDGIKQSSSIKESARIMPQPPESRSSVSGLTAQPPVSKKGQSLSEHSRHQRRHPAQLFRQLQQKKLSDKQKEAIHNLFYQNIKNKVNFMSSYVRNKWCTSSVLGKLALQKTRVKQVINLINYLKAREDTASPDKLPATSAGSAKVKSWLDDFDDPSTRSSGKRAVWDEEETKPLEK